MKEDAVFRPCCNDLVRFLTTISHHFLESTPASAPDPTRYKLQHVTLSYTPYHLTGLQHLVYTFVDTNYL